MIHARKDYNRIQDPLPEDLGGISADEPVFLLRAKDMVAWKAVLYWARQAEAAGADPRIVEHARQQADRMRQWPVKQCPDMPEDA